MKAKPCVQNLVQFCMANGYSTDYDVLGHIHAGLRSAPQTKTYKRWNERTLAKLQASRDAGIAAYRLAVERKEVLQPPKQTTEEIAAAYSDTVRGQAAARLIAKRAARKAVAKADESREVAE